MLKICYLSRHKEDIKEFRKQKIVAIESDRSFGNTKVVTFFFFFVQTFF